MLYINDQLPHLKQAKRLHIQYITCYINRKLYGKGPKTICSDVTCKVCNSKIQKMQMSKYLLSVLVQIDFKKLIGSSPREILKEHEKFFRLYRQSRVRISDRDLKSLNSLINYEWFITNDTYNAYDFCQILKIESCVYCNRLYTATVITDKNERIIRPTLDHWFPQNQFPLLSLSFYNLIPSCSPCNSSVKHMAKFNLMKHTHPYIDQNITSNYKLVSTYNSSLNTFKVTIDTKDNRIKSTMELMKIQDIYQHHQSELADLDLLKRKYNRRYLKDLGALLDTKLSEKEVYRIMFGVEYEDENFSNRPLSKLKRDILNFKLKP